MPHTEGRYMMDLGFTDAKIHAGAGDAIFTGTAPTLTANNPGFSNNFTTSASASVIGVNITNLILRRLGFFEDIQEQFGSTSGAGIAGSAQIRTYRPDVIGAMSAAQQLQPRTAFKTKGFRLISYDVIYGISGAANTVHTTRVDSVTFANNVAISNVVVLASAANGLQTATQANPYVTTVTPSVQTYFTLNDSQLWIQINETTGTGGTYIFYGIDISIEFNFN
jgi:hypothetical protein